MSDPKALKTIGLVVVCADGALQFFEPWKEDDAHAFADWAHGPRPVEQLVDRKAAERLMSERDARIAQLERERDEAIAETKRMRSAADELLEACDASNGSCYGTLSTSFVMSVLGETCTDRDARIAELRRERDEAMRDAQRYRWLRDNATDVNLYSDPDNGVALYTFRRGWHARTLDAAIDAAMKGGVR